MFSVTNALKSCVPINTLIHSFILSISLSKESLSYSFIYLFEYILPEFSGGAYFLIQRGLLFYLIGAVIHKNINTLRIKRSVLFIGFSSCWVLSVVVNFCARSYTMILINDVPIKIKLLKRLCIAMYSDIFVPLAALSMFLIFAGINLKSNRKINTVAKTTFGIYLIHDSAGLRTFIWDDFFRVAEMQYNSNIFIFYAFLTIIIIYILCLIIDLFRIKYIEPVVLMHTKSLIIKLKEACLNEQDYK